MAVNTTVLSESDLNHVVNTTGRAQLKKYWPSAPPFYQNQIWTRSSTPPDGPNQKNNDRPHHRFVRTGIEPGRQHHRTGPTEKILTVHTTVLSESDLNQVVNTTVLGQPEKYWPSAPPFYQIQIWNRSSTPPDGPDRKNIGWN